MSVPTAQESGQKENPRVPLFGPRLKEQREKRGITLEQISKSTKIGTRFLEALEQDQFERLPGGIFNKGFVRAYARSIGLDEEQAVSDYLTASGANEPKTDALDEPPVLAPPPDAIRNRSAGMPWGIIATVLLVTAFGFAVWGFYFRATTTREKEPAQSLPSQTSAAASPVSSSTPNPSLPQTLSSSPNSSTAAAKAATESSGQAAVNSGAASSEKEPSGVHDLVLRITARDDAWLSITVDGEVTSELTLTSAAEKTVRARNQIVIKTGSAGALDFEFNGRQLPVQGKIGEVKTIAFTAAGWHPVEKPPTPGQPETFP